MDKQLRYRFSYIHNGEKHWRVSPATIATVEAFLAANELDADLDPADVIRALDLNGTYVTLRESNEDTYAAGTNIVEIDEHYVDA